MTTTNNQNYEYKQLYDEIGRNSVISQNVFIANVAVTASLIGYGLSAESGPIFLAPFAIIIPSLFFIASQLESTTRIACYIIVYLESKNNNINWESRWYDLRDKDLIPSKRKYTLSLSGLYGLLGIVCLLLSFQYWKYDKCTFFYITGPIILLHIRGVTLIVRAFSLKLCKAYIEAWQNLDT
jgi:hypothetical protein